MCCLCSNFGLFTQMQFSRADHLDTVNAWYLAEKINSTNMFIVMKRVVPAENFTRQPDCFCDRDSLDDVVPPECMFETELRLDRYSFDVYQGRLRSLTNDERCECPCYARDPRYEGCGVTFSELVHAVHLQRLCYHSFITSVRYVFLEEYVA